MYQCNLCDKSYSYPGTLKTHMIMSHSEEDSYKCNQCDFLWISIQDLKTHTQVHHRRDPPKSCNACKLRTVGDVAEHNTLFHKQKDATMATMTMHVSCEQCENTFKTSNGLKKNTCWFTVERSLSSVNNASTNVQVILILRNTCLFTLERNHTNANNVATAAHKQVL